MVGVGVEDFADDVGSVSVQDSLRALQHRVVRGLRINLQETYVLYILLSHIGVQGLSPGRYFSGGQPALVVLAGGRLERQYGRPVGIYGNMVVVVGDAGFDRLDIPETIHRNVFHQEVVGLRGRLKGVDFDFRVRDTRHQGKQTSTVSHVQDHIDGRD